MATVSRGTTSERYRFIQKHGVALGICYLCKWLKVSRSGYYDWRKRPESNRSTEDRRLTAKIIRIHQSNREVYGSPRVHAVLKAQGINVSIKRVERLMRQESLVGRVSRVIRRKAGIKALNFPQ